MSLDRRSWGYRANAKLEDYLTSFELIKGGLISSYPFYSTNSVKMAFFLNFFYRIEIVITVSTGGNILINIGPTHRGTIDPIFVERLEAMGKWLRVNGEAIYESTPWTHQKDANTPNIWYTSKKPSNSERNVVYAMLLSYPYETNVIHLHSLVDVFGEKSTIELLGYPKKLTVIFSCSFFFALHF